LEILEDDSSEKEAQVYLVQLLIKLRQLRALRHHVLLHEEGGLQWGKPALHQERQAEVDERLV
jgi:hypothetical protein